MTEQTDAAEVEAPVFGLVECSDCTHPAMLHDGNDGCNGDHCDCRWTMWEVLDRWLADWLAAREAAARAEERERVAAAIEADIDEPRPDDNLAERGRRIGMLDAASIARTDGAGS